MTANPLSSLAQNTITILVLPFEVEADPKYDFLQPALADMLFTRLSTSGRTIIVAESGATDGMTRMGAIQAARQKGADYIVTGSVTLQADTIGTDAELIGVAEQRTLIAFTRKGRQPGDVITQIDNFTAQVNADVFSPGTTANGQNSQAQVPGDIYQHPEKMTIPEIPPDEAAENKPRDGQPSRTGLQPRDNR